MGPYLASYRVGPRDGSSASYRYPRGSPSPFRFYSHLGRGKLMSFINWQTFIAFILGVLLSSMVKGVVGKVRGA